MKLVARPDLVCEDSPMRSRGFQRQTMRLTDWPAAVTKSSLPYVVPAAQYETKGPLPYLVSLLSGICYQIITI